MLFASVAVSSPALASPAACIVPTRVVAEHAQVIVQAPSCCTSRSRRAPSTGRCSSPPCRAVTYGGCGDYEIVTNETPLEQAKRVAKEHPYVAP